MNNYELVYIVKPDITEDELTAISTRVGDTAKKFGGNVKEIVNWGKKRFAYPLSRYNDGNYMLAKLEMAPASIKQMEASLKMFDEILRLLVIKQEA